MTSEEIKQKPAIDFSGNSWLKEVAYQLALLNEKQEKPAHQKPVKTNK